MAKKYKTLLLQGILKFTKISFARNHDVTIAC